MGSRACRARDFAASTRARRVRTGMRAGPPEAAMSTCLTADEALAFVRRHGVVLVAARGRAPRLVEAIACETIRGSWWAHPRSRTIYAVLGAVIGSGDVMCCRLVDGKVTLVHRRLWPAMVRLVDRLDAARCAIVVEEHTASGRHATRSVAFTDWVTPDLAREAQALSEAEAVRLFSAWLETRD